MEEQQEVLKEIYKNLGNEYKSPKNATNSKEFKEKQLTFSFYEKIRNIQQNREAFN